MRRSFSIVVDLTGEFVDVPEDVVAEWNVVGEGRSGRESGGGKGLSADVVDVSEANLGAVYKGLRPDLRTMLESRVGRVCLCET